MVKINGHTLRRRVFWLVLVGGIVLLTFLFLFYSGYRFDWHQGRFIQLGSIAVDVLPKESLVFLNDQQLPKTTPAIFNSIRPGEYTLRIQQAGYAPVEFPLTVQSKSATVINKIFLPVLSEATPIEEPESIRPKISEQQLEAAQQVHNWPIWNISGSTPVAIVSGQDRQLSLVYENSVVDVEEDVSNLDTNSDLDQMVYVKTGTAWMVYTNFENLQPFILSRQSTPFRDAILVPGKQAVILTDQNLIQLVEIGPQESLSIHQLATGTDLHSTQLDPTGKILWFKEGEEWYQLELFK